MYGKDIPVWESILLCMRRIYQYGKYTSDAVWERKHRIKCLGRTYDTVWEGYFYVRRIDQMNCGKDASN